MPDPECPEVFPFTLMRDPAAFVAWQQKVGVEEAERVTEQAVRDAMEKYGVRVMLAIAQRMEDMIARMEEFS